MMINDTTRLYPNDHSRKTGDVAYDRLFAVRGGIDSETLLANASQDLASINDIAAHLAFEIDGAQRNMALGICRMLEGVQLLVNKALDEAHPTA